MELEKDIAKLNEEIVKLKYENKQLQAGKAELQQQLRDQKENSDDTIRQLRSMLTNVGRVLCFFVLHIIVHFIMINCCTLLCILLYCD